MMLNQKSYLMFGKPYDYLKIAFDAENVENPIQYVDSIQPYLNMIEKVLCRLILHKKVPKVIRQWFERKVIYTRLIYYHEKEVFYIIVATNWFWLFQEDGFADYIRSRNPKCKIIILFTDNAVKYDAVFKMDKLDWGDWIITFNPKDVEERGYGFFCDVNSKCVNIGKNEFSNRTSDIFFCGRAKDRLETIHDSYKYFKDMGLKCAYYIDGVEERNQLKSSDIVYNHPLSYSEVQKMSSTTRCVLEISVADANGFTYRIEEAMMYGTKVITDRDFIKHFTYYKPNNIFCYKDSIKEVMKEWVLNEITDDYGFDDDIGTEELVKLIEDHFSENPSYPCTKWQAKGDEYIKKLCGYSIEGGI